MDSPIDPKQPLPTYVQLKTLLIEDILRGRYASGGRLPTEHELCQLYGISRTPVSRALTELAQEGVILRHRRRGSFVNPHWVTRNPSSREVRVVVPDGSWADALREAAPPGVALSVATVSLSDLHHVLVHAVAEGRAPDLAVLDSVWVPEFAASGFLTPLDELDPRWVRDEYDNDFIELFAPVNRFGGQVVAVQAEADVAGIWFRRSDLAAVGAEPPRTWDELALLGAELAGRNKSIPITAPGGSRAGETTTYCLLALLASNGATVLGAGAVTLASTSTTECLAFVKRLADDGVLPKDAVSYPRDRPIRQLAHEQASLAFGGSYDASALARASGVPKAKLLDEFGFVGVPAGPHGRVATLAGGMAYAIFRQASQPDLAMQLLRNISSTASLTQMSRSTWQLAPRRSAIAAAASGSPFLRATGDLLDRAVVRPATAQYARVSAQLQAMIEAVLVGRLAPGAASTRAAEMVSAITGLPVERARRRGR